MKTREVNGFYGSNHTPCTVFVAIKGNGSRWYVCEDSVNINLTYDEVENGVDVEELADVDCITASKPVTSEEELIYQIEN